MNNMIGKIEKVVNKIADLQQIISNLFLLLIMAIITFDVLSRNIFNKPVKGAFEMTELASAMLVFFALAITHRHNDHVTIDFLVERFSKKVQHVINGIVELLITAVLFFMALHIFDNGVRLMGRMTTTTDLALPIHPFLFVITFTLIIFALTALFKAVTCFRMAVNKK